MSGPRAHGGDSLTIAFSAPAADVHGVARLGVSDEGGSGLMLLFHRGEPVAVAADGAVALPERPATWGAIGAAGLDVDDDALHWAGDEGALDLTLHALGAQADDAESSDQALRIEGTATIGGQRLSLTGLGQRTRSWAAPDWERTELARTVQVWLPDRAVTATAVRPRGREHGEEELRATVLEHGLNAEESDAAGPGAEEPGAEEPGAEELVAGGHAAALPVDDPRLSTTYDSEGRQRAAGLELWMTDDGPVHRIAGEAVCGTTLDLGRLRLDTAFFRWRSAGVEGAGRYDVLRRTG